VRVVSWNVGRVYTPSDNNRLADEDVPRVARVLSELDADVVLLQELVSPEQLAGLLRRMPGYDGELARDCLYDRKVCALARTRLAPKFEQHRLAATGRGVAAVTFDVNGSARGIALPVHFDVFDKVRRRSQAEDVISIVRARDEAVTVVGGDFNLDPDLAEKLGNTIDVLTFGMIAEQFLDDGRAAGPTLFGILRVDHVLARGPLVDRVYSRVSPGRRLPLGDHDPLVCDVELRTQPIDDARRKP
jgi:endonuclease/exonuclease/phosphatase family metal-dependent hydrolase